MHYYIDGYNLLFRISRADDELQKQRQKIICELEKKISFIKLNATLVFDAHHYMGESVSKHVNCLEIVFTSAGETADEFILQRLKESPHPSQETVATSDKKLAWLSRRCLAHTQTIEEFIVWLNKRYHNKVRTQSQKKSLKLTPLIRPKNPPPKTAPCESSTSTPKVGATVEECFDMYLETFESSLGPMFFETAPSPEDNEPLFAMPPLAAKRQKKPKKRQNPLASDMEHWLKVFERPLDEEIL